ncbi:DUF5753 domain-containing protein [Plantactinospora sp. B24E8]|uniref:DUF5753 domain-containing protein n=1 Tax=Plantactinospora sp. B24E8 TaxID=3153567 RepID=UPI00325D69BF
MNELRELLRRERTRRGLTRDQTGAAVNVSASSVGAFESGRMVPMPDTARAYDTLFETGDEVQRLSAEARSEAQAPWLRPWTDNERRATLLRWFEHSLIPGLLQTEAYARAILAVGPHRPDRVEELTAARLERQTAALDRNDPPTMVAIIGEAALRYGSGPMMKEQLEHLVDMGDRPNVHIRISGRVHHRQPARGRWAPAQLPGRPAPGADRGRRGGHSRSRPDVGEFECSRTAVRPVPRPDPEDSP